MVTSTNVTLLCEKKNCLLVSDEPGTARNRPSLGVQNLGHQVRTAAWDLA